MSAELETTHLAADARVSAVTQWLPRLFRNSYTRDGKRFQLDNWSVKIQHRGERHTFSLDAKTKRAAAVEAKAIHDLILTAGWEAATRYRSRRNRTVNPSPAASEDYWKARLLVRRYPFPPSAEIEKHLAARIDDDGGNGCWFPLGTADPQAAITRAQQIRNVVAEQGWNVACQNFPRELILGFEWCSNPILWTYTTVHSMTTPFSLGAAASSADPNRVLIVEADAGIRRTLEWCLHQQPGFRGVPCDSAEAFAKSVELHRPQLVFLNRNLADRLGFDTAGRIAPIRPGIPAVSYSVVADGDQLFVSTPGGAEGYMLKRISPTRLLDPILDAPKQPNLSNGELLPRVRSYFKHLLLPRHDHESSSGLGRLTRREHEVLALLSKGCVDKEIAQALGISVWTVHGHIKSIFERLRVRTRTEAVVRYLEK